MSRKTKYSIFSVAVAILVSSTMVFGQTPQTTNAPKKFGSSAPERTLDQNYVALGVQMIPSPEGVTVVGIVPNSAAERAGFRVGDEIRYFAGQQVRTTQMLTDLIRNSKPGTQVFLRVYRDGQQQDIAATLSTYQATFGQADPSLTRIAYSYEPEGTVTGQSTESKNQIFALNQKVILLNQQINALSQQLNQRQATSTGDVNSNYLEWWNQNQRGESRGDPSLFQ